MMPKVDVWSCEDDDCTFFVVKGRVVGHFYDDQIDSDGWYPAIGNLAGVVRAYGDEPILKHADLFEFFNTRMGKEREGGREGERLNEWLQAEGESILLPYEEPGAYPEEEGNG